MTDKPKDCPKPGVCPMETREFIERMAKIEHDIREATENRHERNHRLNNVVEEERLARMDLEEMVKENAIQIRRVLETLQGEFGEPGIISDIKHTRSRVDELENWRHNQKAFLAGVVATSSVVGTVFGAIVGVVIHYIFKK